MKSKYNLLIYPLAKKDMESIFQYIGDELCNPAAALRLIRSFEKAFEHICLFPESCPYVQNENVRDRTLRKLVVKKYIVFYRVRNQQIQIIRVLYGMRNYEELL